MKTPVIYHSTHHGNTEKIAGVISEVFGAELLKPPAVKVYELHQYDFIGFGSGVYFGKHHKVLLNFVKKLPPLGKKVFIFSTSGKGMVGNYHKALRAELLQIKCEIIGEFACKGFDTFGLFSLIGGINNGHPDRDDVENAKAFARSLQKKILAMDNGSVG